MPLNNAGRGRTPALAGTILGAALVCGLVSYALTPSPHMPARSSTAAPGGPSPALTKPDRPARHRAASPAPLRADHVRPPTSSLPAVGAALTPEPFEQRTEEERRALTNEDFEPALPSSNAGDPRLTEGERQTLEDVLRESAARRPLTQAELEQRLVEGEDDLSAPAPRPLTPEAQRALTDE